MDETSLEESSDSLDRVRVFGLDFVNSNSLAEVSDAILNFSSSSLSADSTTVPVVLTPNVDIVVWLNEMKGSSDEAMFENAKFCLPDGQPIVAASRLLKTPLSARLPGSGLFEQIWPKIAAEGRPVVVVASTKEISGLLGEEHPKAEFIVPPMFDADDKQATELIATDVANAIGISGAEMVIIGVGNPKDVRIANNLFEHWPPSLPKPLCLCLGGSFAMYLGLKKRAPEWVQKIGMEWFFRFAQEPRRLFHRYFVRDVGFIGIVWSEWRSRKLSRP